MPAALAQTDSPPTLERCAAIGAPTDRLACYDALAGRARASEALGTRAEAVGVVHAPTAPPSSDPSFLSRFWELDAGDKRGIFNFVGYQGNYVLPIHLTSRINRAPQSPTQAAVPQPAYRTEEAKFQLSLRTKLVQNVGFEGADVWAAFTQQAMWQIYNGTDSKPFRNTDYQPELIYVVPTKPGLRKLPFDWQWRYTQLGLAHQSNGQSDPLSRSWNRVYLGGGFERSPWVLSAKVNKRLNEPRETDNNPDLVDFRGRGEFQLGWSGGLHTASVHYRSTLKDVKYGSLHLEWTYPVYNDQPNGLRWFVQAFSGYGETLTDYNFRQNSIGAGVTFLQF
ncbi:MAG: phospholipase [Methylibium sp. NZG]|nr:MAG: phospholipase [Methylibium sp. NZG]